MLRRAVQAAKQAWRDPPHGAIGGPVKWLDVPPLWLLAFAVLAWTQSRVLPLPGRDWATPVGLVLVAAGILLTIAALAVMQAARTTPVPHRQPSALVTNGPFRLSRNPIYLADLLMLTGLVIHWRAWPSLLLVPLFLLLLERRFIRAEEARCAAGFGPTWEAYAARTRRWL